MKISYPLPRGAARSVALATSLVLAALAVLSSPDAGAAPISVNNHSFERPALGAGGWGNDLIDPDVVDPATDPDWLGRDGTNSGDAFIEFIGGFVSEGSQHIGTQNGYYLFQNTGVPWQANTTYTLKVGVGNRNDGQSPAGTMTTVGLTALDEPPGDLNLLEGFDTDDQLLVDTVLSANAITFETADSWTPNGSFKDQTVVVTTDGSPPTGNVVIFLGDMLTGGRSHFDNVRLDATSALNPDGDGIPTEWEEANGTDPAVDDGADNPDGDGFTNFQEWQNGTHPLKADTDDDGLNDDAETTTDPLNPDTDGDTLLDGAEVNTHGTSPLLADTDGDDWEDQAELAGGGDPVEAGVGIPDIDGDLVVGLNFVGGAADTPGSSVTGTAGVVPQENWNNADGAAGDGMSLVDFGGAATLLRASWATNGPGIIGFTPPAGDPNDQLMYGHLLARGGGGGDSVDTVVTVKNIAYPNYDVYVYIDADSFAGSSDYTVNGESILGVLDEDSWPVGTGTGTFVLATGDNTPGNYIVFRGVTGSTLTITGVGVSDPGGRVNGIQIVRSSTDSDSDGMPDLWEDSNGLNKNDPGDAATSLDADQLSNLQEYQRGTNPNNPDTDGDGLPDHVEDGGGVFVSSTMTGSSPIVADTDGDGFTDNVENGSKTFNGAADPGSDPNKADSDGDGYDDRREAEAGFNPNDPASKPPFPTVVAYWSFDDQGAATTADLGANGWTGTLNGGPTYVAGQSGMDGDFALDFDGADDYVGTMLIMEDPVTFEGYERFSMVGWVKYDAQQAGRTGFWGQNDAFEFGPDGANLNLWTPSEGTTGFAFPGAPAGWTHVAVTGDETDVRLFIDGVQRARNDAALPRGTSFEFFNIGGGGIWDNVSANGNWFLGQIDDVAVYDEALVENEILALANGEVNPLGQPVGGGGGSSDFQVTLITRDATTEEVAITFNSEIGVEYFLDYLNEAGTWQELQDLGGAATSTTSVFTTSSAGVDDRLYQVRRASP